MEREGSNAPPSPAVASSLVLPPRPSPPSKSSPQRKKGDDVEHYPRALDLSGRILTALRHFIMLAGTGVGQAQNMEAARALMRTAVNYRCAGGVGVFWGGGGAGMTSVGHPPTVLHQGQWMANPLCSCQHATPRGCGVAGGGGCGRAGTTQPTR